MSKQCFSVVSTTGMGTRSKSLCGEASLLLLRSWARTSQGLGSTGLIWDGVQGFWLLTSMLFARRCPFTQVPRGPNSQSILWLFCEYHGTVHPPPQGDGLQPPARDGRA